MAKLPIGRLTESVTFLSSTPPPIAVTSLTALGTVASGTTGTPHGLTSGDYVSIRGAVPLVFNTTSAPVTVTSATQFSYDLPASIGGPAYVDVVLSDNPSHYWRLNETSGTLAADSAGSAPGTLSGGVTVAQPGALSDGTTAMLFNGTTAKIVTAAEAVTIPVAYTFEAWTKTSQATQRPMVSGRAPGFASTLYYFGTKPGGGGQLYFYTSGALVGTRGLADGVWHHVVGTDTGSESRIYVDGVLDGVLSHAAQVADTGQLSLGHDLSDVTYWDGFLDEVAIYPRVLSPAEITEHYQAGAGGGPVVATGTITVTFQSDSQGGQPDDWYDAGQAFAFIEPLTAAERLAVSAVAATVNYRAVIHYRTNLTPQMKLMWLRYQETDPRELAIFGVYPHPEPAYAHRFLVLECGELA